MTIKNQRLDMYFLHGRCLANIIQILPELPIFSKQRKKSKKEEQLPPLPERVYIF